jgi:hypothetical protein
MARDRSQRKTLARVDGPNRRGLVSAARRIIYEKKFQVNSAAVEAMLRNESWVPNVVRKPLHLLVFLLVRLKIESLQNAFSDRLSSYGFNLFKMLLPDLMHEFELGVWRAIFIHLLRILQSVDESLLLELDRRWVEFWDIGCLEPNFQASYREIPSFGRDTIRRFAANCSEMKKMAAHDFENLLQVSKAAFYIIMKI